MQPFKLIKSLFLLLFSSAMLILSSPGFGQYYHHGKYSNLWITSDFFGYWSESFQVSSHGYKYMLYRVDNWESTLIREKTGDFGGYHLFRPFFINDSLGFIGEVYQGSLQVYKTIDYGGNWNEYGGGSSINARMYYLDSFTGYVSHYPAYGNPSFVHGFGKGNSWQSTDYQFDGKVLYFMNDSTGFVSGLDTSGNHCLLRTLDYGLSWQDNFCDASIAVNDIYFFSSQYGFFVANSGLIMRTNDGGDSWEQLNSGCTVHLNCIRFYNEDDVIIVGNDGTVLRSYNRGDSWQQEENNLESNLIFVTITGTRTFLQDEEWNLYSDKAIEITESLNHQDILIFPNPAEEILTISGLAEKKHTLKLFNANGVLILHESGSRQLNVSRLKPGIYYLQIESSDNRAVVRKFIKI